MLPWCQERRSKEWSVAEFISRISKALEMKSKSFLTASNAQYSLSLPYLSSLMFNNPPFTPHAVSWSTTDILGPLLCHAPSYHPIALISAALSFSYQPLHLANLHSTLRTRTRPPPSVLCHQYLINCLKHRKLKKIISPWMNIQGFWATTPMVHKEKGISRGRKTLKYLRAVTCV